MTDIKREGVETAMVDAHESSFACAECAFLGPCRRCRTLAMVIALGEQWLEARRARWDRRALVSGDGKVLFVIGRRSDGWWVDNTSGMLIQDCATEAEARAWLEARAIADGYEIVREP